MTNGFSTDMSLLARLLYQAEIHKMFPDEPDSLIGLTWVAACIVKDTFSKDNWYNGDVAIVSKRTWGADADSVRYETGARGIGYNSLEIKPDVPAEEHIEKLQHWLENCIYCWVVLPNEMQDRASFYKNNDNR